jgi:polyhydroxyalkanoate synthesis regulator phasin
MMASYDIQGAGHVDTLKLVCKTSLKANQLIDIGDIEGFQKMSKVYDSLMKSGKFTAQQNKAEQADFVDSIGELIELCE